jgi:presenilin-like A22 family membrane protease
VKGTIVALMSVFILTQIVAIGIVGLITDPGSAPDEPREPRMDYIEGGDTIESSMQIYVFLIMGVGLLALAIKLKLGRIVFKHLESLIIFLTVFLLFISIYPSLSYLWILPALGVVLVKRAYPHWTLVTGLSILLASIVGAIMGVSFGITPILALMLFLSAYDIVAVKFSSHMGNVVKNVRGTKSTFLIEIPGLRAAVGISDLAVPAMFVAANFLWNSTGLALVVAAGGAFGLALAIFYSNRTGMVPALPFIFGGILSVYLPVAYL